MQLTISTLRQALARLQCEHGDLPVMLNDADTEWSFRLKAEHLKVQPTSTGRALAIGVEYGNELAD